MKWPLAAALFVSGAGSLCFAVRVVEAPPIPPQSVLPPINWAIQGQDAAIKSCPDQYGQYADVDGVEWLIGCWGKK